LTPFRSLSPVRLTLLSRFWSAEPSVRTM
jgi:hypothetical protein